MMAVPEGPQAPTFTPTFVELHNLLEERPRALKWLFEIERAGVPSAYELLNSRQVEAHLTLGRVRCRPLVPGVFAPEDVNARVHAARAVLAAPQAPPLEPEVVGIVGQALLAMQDVLTDQTAERAYQQWLEEGRQQLTASSQPGVAHIPIVAADENRENESATAASVTDATATAASVTDATATDAVALLRAHGVEGIFRRDAERVVDLLQHNQQAPALKALREAFPELDMKESKDVMDALIRDFEDDDFEDDDFEDDDFEDDDFEDDDFENDPLQQPGRQANESKVEEGGATGERKAQAAQHTAPQQNTAPQQKTAARQNTAPQTPTTVDTYSGLFGVLSGQEIKADQKAFDECKIAVLNQRLPVSSLTRAGAWRALRGEIATIARPVNTVDNWIGQVSGTPEEIIHVPEGQAPSEAAARIVQSYEQNLFRLGVRHIALLKIKFTARGFTYPLCPAIEELKKSNLHEHWHHTLSAVSVTETSQFGITVLFLCEGRVIRYFLWRTNKRRRGLANWMNPTDLLRFWHDPNSLHSVTLGAWNEAIQAVTLGQLREDALGGRVLSAREAAQDEADAAAAATDY